MWQTLQDPCIPIFCHFIEPYFKEGIEISESNQPPQVIQEPLTRYTVDGDYHAALDTVSAMFSRLPTDWHSRYHEEVSGGEQYSYTALSAVIKAITVDMGIEVGDVVPGELLDDDEDKETEDRRTPRWSGRVAGLTLAQPPYTPALPG